MFKNGPLWELLNIQLIKQYITHFYFTAEYNCKSTTNENTPTLLALRLSLGIKSTKVSLHLLCFNE